MKQFFAYLLLVAFLSSCNQCNHKTTIPKPDVADVKITLKITRFEKDFFSADAINPTKGIQQLQQKYPAFLPFYFQNIMGFGDIEKDPQVSAINFSVYRNDKYVKEVADTCLKVFEDFSLYQKQLTEAFQYFKHYFPKKNIPEIITFTGNFGWSAVTFDTNIIGIGVDMYLGKKYKYYPSVYPQYLYEKFEPDYMAANAMDVWGSLQFKFEPKDNSLLAQFIANGIRLYYLDLMLPETADHLKITYNEKDIEWCKKNENQIWGYFVKNDLLYKNEVKNIKKFIGPAPNTSGMPVESPGNIGAWVGWHIVRAYTAKKPNTTIEQLLLLSPQQILNESKYKPK
jgi:hypothetical protein